MYLSTVTCSQEHFGVVGVVVGLGSRIVLVSPLGQHRLPRAGLCSVLGATRQRRWLYGSSARSSENMGIEALLLQRITKSEYT